MTKPAPPETKTFDVALVGGKTDDGAGLKVLRLRPEGASIGEVRPLQEGKPIQGEVVQLKPRQETPWVCDVDVSLPARTAPTSVAPAEASSHHGPARVATPAYRSNWERIFGEAQADEPIDKNSLN